MTKLYRLTCLLILLSFYAQAQPTQSVITRTENQSGKPMFRHFDPKSQALRAADIQQVLKQHVNPGAHSELIRFQTTRDKLGFTEERYQQYYKGVRVEYGVYKVLSRRRFIESISGEYYHLPELSVQPVLSEEAALQNALSFVGAQTYQWQIPSEEKWIKEHENNPLATFYPKGELVICKISIGSSASAGEQMALAYKFDLYAHEPLSRAYLYVDARTGQIIHRNAIIKHAGGTAATRYSASQTIQTEQKGASFRLRDLSRGQGVETYNMQKGSNYGLAVDFTDNDNNWSAAEFDNTNRDNAALDAHWGAMKTYDYWKNVHNRLSFDGNNTKIKNYVHQGAITKMLSGMEV